ncbi:MAG: helix-turn-helix transcriptional regulator [Dorea sp.]|jgi:repressor LexA|nr:helix-turn-helix transcriptional regulator [Dorea sp.]MCI9453201.1 helix-turn-helix transcriptional regulator [Dorea sp.]
MGIGSKLSKLLEKKDTNPNELAKQVGVSPQTIYSIIKRDSKKADIEVLLKIADILGVTVEYFVDDAKPTNSASNTYLSSLDYKLLDQYHNLDSYGQETVLIVLNREVDRVKKLDDIKLRIKELEKELHKDSYILELPTENTEQPTRTLNYYQRLASAGTGQIVFDDVPVDLIEIPDIPEYDRVKYAIGVNGDSMEPLYYDGDVLLVEPMQDVRVDEIGIFIVDGESLVKKRGKQTLISLNKKKKYPDIPIDEETRCLGRVVDKITSPDNLFAALSPDDLAAIEQGAELLRAEAFGFEEEDDMPDIEESIDAHKPPSAPPSISALAPEDLKALEEGMKLLRGEKKA